jgi:molecular chaperone Hsp33
MDQTINLDGILRVSLMGGQARAFLIDSTRMVDEARRVHNLSRVATASLGRLLTGASIMGCMLKNDRDSLTATIKGGGPLGTLLAVARADGTVKGYVDNPDVELPLRADGKLDVGGAVGKRGQLTVIKDMGMKEPYVGMVNLRSGEIGEDLAMYFTASEQTPSLVSLGVLVSDDRVEAAGGLIVQVMPGASEAAIASIEHSAGMFMDISATMREYHLKDAVPQLLLHLEPEILEARMPKYVCDCSRERIERMLITLGSDELDDMIKTQHGAQVDCHFCNKRYEFSEDDLKILLEAATIREDR